VLGVGISSEVSPSEFVGQTAAPPIRPLEGVNSPPQQFAAYPRPGAGTSEMADTLQLLSDGYFGLNLAFGLCILVGVVGYILLLGLPSVGLPPVVAVAAVVFILGVTYVASIALILKPTKKLGQAMGWSPVIPWVASIATVFCLGLIGFVILQQIASSRMKSLFGVRGGFFGIKKAVVNRRIAELRAPSNPVA
jgi:hypothetical protein